MAETHTLERPVGSRGLPARPVALVADRKVDVLPYVEGHRTLHLVDIENEAGGTDLDVTRIAEVLDAYKQAARFEEGDLMIIGCNRYLAVLVKHAAPKRRVVHREGPDGADLALLEAAGDATWIAERFQRVVIGSGDHIFADLAQELADLGVPVGIVHRPGSLSRIFNLIARIWIRTLDLGNDDDPPSDDALPSSDAA